MLFHCIRAFDILLYVRIRLTFLSLSLTPFFHRLLHGVFEVVRPHLLYIPASLVTTPRSAADDIRSDVVLGLGMLLLIIIR